MSQLQFPQSAVNVAKHPILISEPCKHPLRMFGDRHLFPLRREMNIIHADMKDGETDTAVSGQRPDDVVSEA